MGAQRRAEEMATLASKANKSKRVEVKTKSKSDKDSPAQILRNYLLSERTHTEILDEIRRISLARKFDQKKKLQMSIDALCKLDTLENFSEGLTKYKDIFATFARNKGDAKVFMGVFEEFVCRRNKDAFLDTVYKLLLVLYENDIVEEEDLLKWDSLELDKAVIVDQEEAQIIRQKAAPFIKWLKENESDSD